MVSLEESIAKKLNERADLARQDNPSGARIRELEAEARGVRGNLRYFQDLVKVKEEKAGEFARRWHEVEDQRDQLADVNRRLKNRIEHLEASALVDRIYEQAQEDEIWALREKCDALEGRPNRSKVERWVHGNAVAL